MLDPERWKALAQAFIATLPPGMEALQADLERRLRHFLQQTFSQMDLVTREEFDIQAQVLQKSRAKLERLETTLAEWIDAQSKGVPPHKK